MMLGLVNRFRLLIRLNYWRRNVSNRILDLIFDIGLNFVMLCS